MIVTICSSKKFETEMMDAYREISKAGHLAFLPVFHSEGQMNKKDLIKLHLKKISKSDAIFVLDIGGSIEESILIEITYAEVLDIPVYYYSKTGFGGFKDVKEPIQIYGMEIDSLSNPPL